MTGIMTVMTGVMEGTTEGINPSQQKFPASLRGILYLNI